MKRLLAFAFAVISACAWAQDAPKHLELGRTLIQEVKPENNKYAFNNVINEKKDLFSFGEVRVSADCVGFVNFVLDRTNSKAFKQLKAGTNWKIAPRTDAYYIAIMNGIGFDRVKRPQDIEPGDLIVWQFVGHASPTVPGAYGHIMIANAKAVEIKPRRPLVPDTKQWTVEVLDSSPSPHGPTDTRYVKGGPPFNEGIGRGLFRLYTDADDNIVGYSWSETAQKFWPDPIAVGRAR